LSKSKNCTDTYVLVSMNAQQRAEAERVVNTANAADANDAAANADAPASPNAPPVVPAVVPPQVVIGNDALLQLLLARQPQPLAAGAAAPEQAGSTRLKAFSSTDAVEYMSWKTHYLEVCEISNWNNICRVRGPERPCQRRQPDTRPTSSLSTSRIRGAIHQCLSIILKLRILVLLPVSTMPFVVMVNNYS
jgi:hypothetical protein